MKKLGKFLLAVLLLPTVFFAAAQTFGALWNVLKNFQTAVGFMAGGALYCVIHFLGFHFDRVYVWAHETTHAAAAMLFGFRVHSMSVGKNGGCVKMDRCNAFVALAPYFVPLYALLAALLYAGISLAADVSAYREVFVFAVGFFMAFHFVQTFQTLWETDQPDLQAAGGRLFSAVIIVLCNALVLALALKCLFPDKVDLTQMLRGTLAGSCDGWKIVINYILDAWAAARA